MRSYHRQRLALLHKAAQHRMEHQAHQGMRLHDHKIKTAFFTKPKNYTKNNLTRNV